MSELILDVHQVLALANQERGERMAQVVEADPPQPTFSSTL
jgi:hypothetical protein